MNEPANDSEGLRRCLSELLDGEADEASRQRGCEFWARDAEARRTWHTYSLIGDVLRSDELAAAPSHDADFLARLRERLTDEPAVLAPPPRVRRGPRFAWSVPMAVAAGFVAVAGVLVVLQLGGPSSERPADAALADAAPPPSALRVVRVPEGQMLRDAHIDEYLRAHRATLAGSPAALPGGAMRNVELILPPR